MTSKQGCRSPQLFLLLGLYVMLCVIWNHLYNFKNVKSTHGGVLLLVKFKATHLHGCFSGNCANGTKSRKTSHIDFFLSNVPKERFWRNYFSNHIPNCVNKVDSGLCPYSYNIVSDDFIVLERRNGVLVLREKFCDSNTSLDISQNLRTSQKCLTLLPNLFCFHIFNTDWPGNPKYWQTDFTYFY